jgi:hypothetical protein
LQQAEVDLKCCQAEVKRLRGKLWNQRAGDGALGTAMAVIATLDAVFAKAQVENIWGDASKESVKELIVNLSAAVASAHMIKNSLNTAKALPSTDPITRRGLSRPRVPICSEHAKRLFFKPNETTMQLHVPPSENVLSRIGDTLKTRA